MRLDGRVRGQLRRDARVPKAVRGDVQGTHQRVHVDAGRGPVRRDLRGAGTVRLAPTLRVPDEPVVLVDAGRASERRGVRGGERAGPGPLEPFALRRSLNEFSMEHPPPLRKTRNMQF